MKWHSKILGHDANCAFLEKMATRDILPNAFLFVGPRDISKFRIAKDFAKLLNQSDISMQREIDKNISPDVILLGDLWQAGKLEDWDIISLTSNFEQKHRTGVDGESPRRSNTIGVRDIHSFLRPFCNSSSAKWKVGIIRNADRMTSEAANALLKTLEEPPPQTIFVLTVTHEQNLSETIVSRCQILRFGLVPRKRLAEFLDLQGVESAEQQEMLTIAQGRSEIIHHFLADPEFYDDEREWFQRISRAFFAPGSQKSALAAELAEADQAENCLIFLQNLTRFLRSILVEKVMKKELDIAQKIHITTVLQILAETESTRRGLAANANRKLLMEHLLFSLP